MYAHLARIFFSFFFLYLRRATGAFLPPYAPDMETRAVKMSTMIACWEMILHKTRCPFASFLPSLPSRSLSLFRLSLSLLFFSHVSHRIREIPPTLCNARFFLTMYSGLDEQYKRNVVHSMPKLAFRIRLFH